MKFTDKGIDEAYAPPGNDAYTPPGMDVSDDEDKDDAPKTTETPVKEFKLPAKFKDVEFSKKSNKTVNEFNICFVIFSIDVYICDTSRLITGPLLGEVKMPRGLSVRAP